MTSLEKFGTIAFDLDFMKTVIQYGEVVEDKRTGELRIDQLLNPNGVCLELWSNAIPKIYEGEVLNEIIEEITQKYLFEKADEATRLQLIQELHTAIWERVKPI